MSWESWREGKKETGKRAEHDGKGEEIPCDFYIYIFFGFFIGIPSGASAKERGVVWFGSSVLGMSEPTLSEV